jgi:hypothetical protein
MAEDPTVREWHKRLRAAEALKKNWVQKRRVADCYDYWNGDQLAEPFDEHSDRRAQVNKIWADVRANVPSLYFYRPFARLVAEPELADTPGSAIEDETQTLQDTVNHIIRMRDTGFRENTYLPLIEAHWSLGCVEVGYSAHYKDAPNAERPPLKEKEDTKIKETPPRDDSILGLEEMEAEIQDLKSRLTEKFYVKHIPAKQILISQSDKPILLNNDWVGYWEDVPLQDVQRTKAYDNTKDLKASVPGDEQSREEIKEIEQKMGEPEKVRLYKIWDLRTNEKLVLANDHHQYLLREPVKRCQLKFLRFDTDPEHFLPRPPILNKLGVQDDYNRGREFVRLTMKGRVPRFTYDRNLLSPEDMKKLEQGDHGMYVAQDGGNGQSAIMPVPQPNLSDSAIQSLTLSDKEFEDVGGVGGDAKTSQEATATQAKIAAVKNQVADSFDRGIVADWLGSICEELLRLAIENMNVDQIIAMNVAPDSQLSPQIGMQVAQTFKTVNAQTLSKAQTGLSWSVQIDVESLSPVSEEEAFQKWMQGMTLIANPAMQELFAVSPEMFKMTLEKMGIRSARDQELMIGSLQKLAQQRMQQMQMQAMAGGSAPKQPGVSPMGGSPKPGTPQPGGPQPGGPPGPGASTPQ